MAHLEDITAAELRGCLSEIDGTRPTLRLVAGINYKEGVAASTIANWYDVSEATVHNWLNRLERLEDEPTEAVLYDAPRSGRPRKLSSAEWKVLHTILEETPSTFGIDSPHWTPRIVQQLIEERFDTTYTRRYIQDLLHEAGCSWKTARPEYAGGDKRAREAFKEGFEKN